MNILKFKIIYFLLFIKDISALSHTISIRNTSNFDSITGTYTINDKIYDEIEIVNCEKKIRILNIIDTSIACINSKTFEKLPNLEVLNLENNEFKEFPQSVFSIKKLRGLSLKNNKLMNIPQNINNLSNLQILDLSYNFLSELPDALFNLTELLELYLGRKH